MINCHFLCFEILTLKISSHVNNLSDFFFLLSEFWSSVRITDDLFRSCANLSAFFYYETKKINTIINLMKIHECMILEDMISLHSYLVK